MAQTERQDDGDPSDLDDDVDLFDIEDPEWDAKCDAEADADISAGRRVPHSEVVKWLLTWGTPDETPMPEEWLK